MRMHILLVSGTVLSSTVLSSNLSSLSYLRSDDLLVQKPSKMLRQSEKHNQDLRKFTYSVVGIFIKKIIIFGLGLIQVVICASPKSTQVNKKGEKLTYLQVAEVHSPEQEIFETL